MLHRSILRIVRFHNTDPSKLQSISNKPFFKHYKTAINLCLENKLQQSNQQFTKSLYEIKNSKETQLEHFSYILRRIAHNFRRLGRMKQAEEKIYQAIKHKRQCKVNPALLYDDYDVLFRHLITYDLDKAVKLCKALLAKEKQDMPISHIKLFNFNIGSAYLLATNYQDAKSRLSKCLESDPQGKLKSYALNNLGLACWWHKNPIEKTRDQIEKNDNTKVQKDFNQARQIFAKSIQVSEEIVHQKSDLQKVLLNQTLDFKKGILNEELSLTSAASLFPTYNLSKFYILNDPLQRFQILYWLKKSLQVAKTTKNQKAFDHIFTQYSILTNNLQPLHEKLPSLIQKYRYSQQFAEEFNYCSILGSLLETKQPQKSAEYLQRAAVIKGVLPIWTWKLKYLALDELDLTS